MSFETDSWTRLSQEQASFFRTQTQAAYQTVVGEAAQQAGATLRGVPGGAVFDSDDGLTVIRRNDGYPSMITLATAPRPKFDDPLVVVEQHYIDALGATMALSTLPVEAYQPPLLLVAVTSETGSTPFEEIEEPSSLRLGSTGIEALERKMLRLLTGRLDSLAGDR